jgi:hypothetical protein
LHAGDALLRRGLGVPHFAAMSLFSLLLFYFLPLYLWLIHTRYGLSLPKLRENLGLLRWLLLGLVLGNGLGLMLALALAFLLGLAKDADAGPLTALSVAAIQIPYYLWLRRQPDDAL